MLSLGYLVPLPWLVMSGKVVAPFKPRLFKVHLTNSQSIPLPIMGFKYINGLPPIHYSPIRRMVGIMAHLVGIMAHLVVSDLLIYPLSFKEPTHT